MTTFTTPYNPFTQQQLKDLCKPLTAIGGPQALGYENTNDFLINLYADEIKSQTGEDVTFNTYKGWKESGHQVTKGSKAFKIWSSPKPRKAKKGQKLTEEQKEDKVFYTASLFCSLQVSQSSSVSEIK